MPKITFQPKEGNVIVAGKTFYVKEMLKKAGARWNGSWTLNADVATKEFLAELNEMLAIAIQEEKKVEAKKREDAAALHAFYQTPEGKEQRWKEILQLKEAAYFICCKECVVIDWDRKHTTCEACNPGKFFVRGMLYTGD